MNGTPMRLFNSAAKTLLSIAGAPRCRFNSGANSLAAVDIYITLCKWTHKT